MADEHGATTAADAEAPDVFLSYAREDQQIVLRLASALEETDWRVWVDTEDIPPTADWGEELAEGIRNAHTFVFVISPDSVRSPYCRKELEQAVQMGKRLVPVVIRDAQTVPEELAARQYIFMRDVDDFDQSMATLTAALGTDLEWVREHRQWLMAAMRWDARGRDRSLLLRGGNLKAAEAWLARQADRTEPRPTRVQTEFLIASRSWETRRLQIVIGAVVLALVVAGLLGVLALLQRNAARTSAAIALSRELAIASVAQLPVDPERSLLLAIEATKTRPTAEAGNALRRAVLASRLRVEIPTHGQTVRSLVSDVAFSPDGKTIGAALGDGTVRIADLTAGARARIVSLPFPKPTPGDPCTLFARSQGKARIAFSSDGRLIGTAGSRGWIEIWRWPRPTTPTTSPFCLGQAGKPSSSAITSAIVGDAGGYAVAAMTFAGDDAVEIIDKDGRVFRWRWVTDAAPLAARLSRLPVLSAGFSERGRTASFADSQSVSVLASGRRAAAVLPARGVYALALSADGHRLAAAHGRSISVWRPGTAVKPVELATHDVVMSIAISRDGQLVAIGDEAGAVRVWRVSRRGPPVVLTGSSGPVTAVSFSPDGHRVASGADDGELRVWDWDSSRPLPRVASTAGTRVFVTHDGRLIARDARDPRRAWTTVDGRARLLDGIEDLTSLSLSRTGRRAVASAGKSIRLWDLSRSPDPLTLDAGKPVVAVAASPDGRWIASAEIDRFLLLRWPGKSGLALAQPRLSGGVPPAYVAAAFSPDSRRLAGAAFNGKISAVSVWELPNGHGAERSFHVSAPGFVTTLAFSPDGKQLLAALNDGTVRVWDLGGDARLIVLRGHHGLVVDAAFSPNGKEVVSGDAHGSIRVWEPGEAGTAVAIPASVGRITGVAFAPDGRAIVASGTAGGRVWSCDFCGPIHDVLARAERMTTRSLTADERALYLHR